MKRKLLTFDEVLKEDLKDPQFRKYYEIEGKKLKLGFKIHKLRNRLHLSQRDFAKKIHTSQATVARLESGDYLGFSLKTLEKIAWGTGAELEIDFRFRQAS